MIRRLFIVLLKKNSRIVPEKIYLKLLYLLIFSKRLNLKTPITYNEKLQWLKLYDKNPEYSNLVDKYTVKEYVANIIGKEHVIPTLGVWDTFDKIDFDQLPNQFVLKTTHDSGGVCICTDKTQFDFKTAKAKLEKHLKNNLYYLNREWPYKSVKPRIIAEKYLVDQSCNELVDYKFFCFNGEPKALFVATERNTGDVKFNFFDLDYNPLDIVQVHEMNMNVPLKPIGFDEMIKYSALLSRDIPHVRVDFYDINGVVYFGELTFFHHGGFVPFKPDKWDTAFGNWIKLPKI